MFHDEGWQERMLALLGSNNPVEFEATLTTLVKVLTAVSNFARGRLLAPQESAKQVGRMLLDLLEPLTAVPAQETTVTPPVEEPEDEGMDASAHVFNARQEALEDAVGRIRGRLRDRHALLQSVRPGDADWAERLERYLLGPALVHPPAPVRESPPRLAVKPFVGWAPKGPTLKPVFLNSMEMYDTVFGKDEHPMRGAVAREFAQSEAQLVMVVRLEEHSKSAITQAMRAIAVRCSSTYEAQPATIIPPKVSE